MLAALATIAEDEFCLSFDAAFNEGDHPRDNDGKFGNGLGGAASKKPEKASKPKLTPTEKTWLSMYSGDHFLSLNKKLREGESGGAFASSLDSAISKSTLPEGTRLYRGMSKANALSLMKGVDLKIGAVITDKGFQSTSASPGIAKQYASTTEHGAGVLFAIDAGAGQKGLNMAGLSDNKSENEVLLPRGTKYQITGYTAAKSPGEKTVFFVKTLPPDEAAKDEGMVANGYAGDCMALDRAAISARTRDDNGHLHVTDVPITRAEINEYLGNEIPGYQELGLKADQRYKLLRDPEELQKALETFNGKPLLDKHRPQYASDNDRRRTVGTVHGAYWDKPFVRVKDFVVWDGDAIQDIDDNETSDISAGYHYTPDMTPGSFEGAAYDGVMRDISANHIALVPDGRVTGCMVTDASLQISGGNIMKFSRKAQIARGALAVYLKPKLAQDAAIDLKAVLADVTAANWPTAKGQVANRLKTATRGKLAQDASIDDIKNVLDCLDEEGAEESDAMDAEEETKEQKEKRLEKEAQDAEEAETEEEKAERLAKRKEAKDKAAKDAAGETAAEVMAREAKEAKDKAAKDAEPKGITKAAMDAALADQAKQIRADMRRDQQLIEEAKEIVQPVIGRVLAQDSAASVYRLLFSAENVDVTGVPESAFKALAVQTVRASGPGTARKSAPAMDAAAALSFDKRFPDAARVRTI